IGHAARIIVPGVDDPEPGKVLSRPAAVDQTGVAADVRIAFNAATRLAAGTPVRVEIVAEQRPNVLVVPTEAILHEDENAFVMVAGPDKKAHKRKITVGLVTPKLVEVTSGLTKGDAVIVKGQQELPDGGDISIAEDGKAEEGKADDEKKDDEKKDGEKKDGAKKHEKKEDRGERKKCVSRRARAAAGAVPSPPPPCSPPPGFPRLPRPRPPPPRRSCSPASSSSATPAHCRRGR